MRNKPADEKKSERVMRPRSSAFEGVIKNGAYVSGIGPKNKRKEKEKRKKNN